MERSYKKAPLCGKKEDNEKLGPSDVRLTKIERSGPYIVQNGITATIDKMAWAADVGLRRSFSASYVSE